MDRIVLSCVICLYVSIMLGPHLEIANVASASCAFNWGFFLSAEKVESEKTAAADVTEIVGWYLSLVFSNCNGKCRFI